MVTTLIFSDSMDAKLFLGAMDEQFPLLPIQASPRTLTGSDVTTVVIPDGSDFGYDNAELYSVVKSLAANYHGIFVCAA